ncbi:MAG: endonuclease/exonuclease/phosphatase family protein [Flavobacteriales bacterium]|nr:endonuclease/exonuclease/phosphatase family protein [Flavobacteriales bacterium]
MDPKKFRELCVSMLILASALIIAFAPDAYLPMLLRAFIVPASVGAFVVALLSVIRRKWWVAQSALLGGAIMLMQVQMPPARDAGTSASSGLRIFHMNVLQPNTAFQEAIAQALASDADLISVQEVGPEWAVELEQGLKGRYPYAHIEPRTNCYGIALFSRVPFAEACTITMDGAPFIEALVDVGGRPVRLLAVHATSPISYGHFRRRNAQLERLGEYLAQGDTATIVVGDLNTVPWDRAYQCFCVRAGLRSTTPALQRTWPSIGPFALIPLDHVLVSAGVWSSALSTVDIPGSDHRGLVADLSF